MKAILKTICFLLIWQIVSTQVNPLFIPCPANVLSALIESIKSGLLLKAFSYSFLRISAASLLSMLIAIPLGLLIKCNYGSAIKPVINLMRYVPVTAFYPLLIMWCGIGETMKIAFLFIAIFVYVLPSTLLAFEEVNQNLIDTGKTLGMSKVQLATKIMLPGAAPSISKSFLMMYGIGWTYIAVAETINAKYGLGFIINVSSARGQTDLVFMAIAVIMIASVLFDKAGNYIIHKSFRWRFVNDTVD